MNLRSIQAPVGTWQPNGVDNRGCESWTIRIPAKEVKARAKARLEWFENRLEEKKAKRREYYREYNLVKGDKKKCTEFFEKRGDFNLFAVEDYQPVVGEWAKWNAYLQLIPDDEPLELTKRDYEYFFDVI